MDELNKLSSPPHLQSPEKLLSPGRGFNECSRSLNAFTHDSTLSNDCEVRGFDTLSLNGSNVLSMNNSDTKATSEMPLLLNISTDESCDPRGSTHDVSVEDPISVVNWTDFKASDSVIEEVLPNTDINDQLIENKCDDLAVSNSYSDDNFLSNPVPEQSVVDPSQSKCDDNIEVIQPAISRNRPTRKACNPVLGRDFVDPTVRGHSKRTAVVDDSGSGDEVNKSDAIRSEPVIRFPVGSLVWARISGHPWWPCMVSKDLDGSNEYTRITGPRHSRRSSFVEFFGPTVEHAWIADNSLIEYKGMEEFKCFAQRKVDEAPKKILKEKLVERFQLKVALSKRTAWEDAVKEADEMLNCSIEERLIWRTKKLEGLKATSKSSTEKSVVKEPSDQVNVPSTPRSISPVQTKPDDSSHEAGNNQEVASPPDVRNARVERSIPRNIPKRLIAATGRSSLPPQRKKSATALKAAAALSRRSQRIMSRKSSKSGSSPNKRVSFSEASTTVVKRLASCTFCNAKFTRNQGPRDVAIHLLHCDKIKGSRMSRCPFCNLCFDRPRLSDHQLKCHVQACSKQAHNLSFVSQTKATRVRSPSSECSPRNDVKNSVKPQTSSRKLRSSTLQKHETLPTRKSSLRRPRLQSSRLDPSYSESSDSVSQSESFKTGDGQNSVATNRNRSNSDRRQSNLGGVRNAPHSNRLLSSKAVKDSTSVGKAKNVNKPAVNTERRGVAAGVDSQAVTSNPNEDDQLTEGSLHDSLMRKPKLRLIRRKTRTPQRSISFAVCCSDDKIAEVSGDEFSAHPMIEDLETRKLPVGVSNRNRISLSKTQDVERKTSSVREPSHIARGRQVEDRRCSAIEALGKGECSASAVASRFGVPPDLVVRDFYGDFASISHSAVMLGRLDLACCVIAEGTRASMAAICHRVPYKYLLMVIRGKSQDYAIEHFNSDYEKWKLSSQQIETPKRHRETVTDDSDVGQSSTASKRQRLEAEHIELDEHSGASECLAGEEVIDHVGQLLRQETVAVDDILGDMADKGHYKDCTSEKAEFASVEFVKRENDYLHSELVDLHQQNPTKISKYYQTPLLTKVDWPGGYTTPARQHNENIRMLNTSLSAYSTRGFNSQDTSCDQSATETADVLGSEEEARIVNEVMGMPEKLWAFDHATNAATAIVLQKAPKGQSHGAQVGPGREWWHFLLLKYPFLRKALLMYFSQGVDQPGQYDEGQVFSGDTLSAANKKRSAA